MTAEQHAYRILRAIQEAEAAGYTVTVDEHTSSVIVADRYHLTEPQEEDEPWEITRD